MVLLISKYRRVFALFSAILIGMLASCQKDHQSANPVNPVVIGNAVAGVDLSSPTQPQISATDIHTSVAKNAWCSFVLRLDCSQLPAHPMLQLPPFAISKDRLASGLTISASQILSVPVNLDDASYVRQTGEAGTLASLPRVLLPLPMVGDAIDLSAAHDPARPSKVGPWPQGGSQGGSLLIWIDLHTSASTVAGDYASQCELVDGKSTQPLGSLPIHLTVENVTLPADTHLHFAAPLDWGAMLSFYPELFQGIAPRLINRADHHFDAALQKIDSYLQLAHENKADFYVPRLQPIAKWPLGKSPDLDWSGFDSVVRPWFSGSGFADGSPVAFWPLPAPDALAGFQLSTQIQYWQQAAGHFDLNQWLDRSPVVLNTEIPGEVNQAESLLLGAQARQILSTYPRLTTMLPLHDDQLELMSEGNSNAIDPRSTARLITAAQGLVYPSPIRNWPTGALPPRHYIDAGARDGSCDITGIASEQGIRTLASLAFVRDASLVLCPNPLPLPGRQPSRSDQLIWCYPGEMFGIDHPLATLQLKWIRQAEQDYEYLFLAGQNKDQANALRLSRLLTRPVQLQPMQPNEPVFNLLAGNTDPLASEEARRLLVARLAKPSSEDVQLQTLRWFAARERPTLAATNVKWMWDLNQLNDATRLRTETGNFVTANVTVDLYNPAEEMPSGNLLDWLFPAGVNTGWENHPPSIQVPSLAQYQVHRATTVARFNLDKITEDSRQPIKLNFSNGYTAQQVSCKLTLPIAISQRRQMPLNLDGLLDDWYPADAIHLDQPLVRMFNRPGLQSGELQINDTPASVYTGWSDDNFYLAFRLGGVTAADLHSTRNFVKYDHGRAWGEDLCEMLIQPIYIDNTTGPTVHIVAKPGGNWVERQVTAPDGTQSWQDFEASGLRFASGVETDKKIWRGEIGIPWKALNTPGRGRPSLLRFNFIQHQQSTAQSSSWAGPLDDSRDGGVSGLLLLKE